MFAAITYNDDDAGNNLDVDPLLSGWTLIDAHIISISGNNEWGSALFYRIADGTEGSSFTFTLDADVDGAVGIVTGYFGVDVTGGVKEDGTPHRKFV